MSRVFILEPTSLDTKEAARFGELVYVFPPRTSRTSIWDERFSEQVVQRLIEEDYDPCSDYFVVVGHMVQMVLASTAICAKWKRFKALLFSSIEHTYKSQTIGAQEDAPTRC